MTENNIQFYTVRELAQVLRVHQNTVYHAIKCGRIQAVRAGKGNRATLRIYKSEVERMMAFDANEIIDNIVQNRVTSALKKRALEKKMDASAQKMLDHIIECIEKERGLAPPPSNEEIL